MVRKENSVIMETSGFRRTVRCALISAALIFQNACANLHPATTNAMRECVPYLKGSDYELLAVERAGEHALSNMAGRIDGHPSYDVVLPYTSKSTYAKLNSVSPPVTLLLIRETQDTIVLCAVQRCSPRIARFKRTTPPGLSERWILQGPWKESICVVP